MNIFVCIKQVPATNKAQVDEKTGVAYFRVDLKIPPAELAKLPKGSKLTPGMPAEAMIVTGRRSILSYVVSPLTDTIRDALRED